MFIICCIIFNCIILLHITKKGEIYKTDKSHANEQK